jgi:hypothetical protein
MSFNPPWIASPLRVSKNFSKLRRIAGLRENEITPHLDNFIEGGDMNRALLVTVEAKRARPEFVFTHSGFDNGLRLTLFQWGFEEFRSVMPQVLLQILDHPSGGKGFLR